MDVKQLTIPELHQAYAKRELTVEAVTGAYLDSITHTDPTVRAFLTVLGEQAIQRAEVLDKQLAAGAKPAGLFGVPIAIKDNLCLAGTRTTAASKILEHYVAPYTATAVQRVLDAGAVVLGKTNLDEFAMGSSTENSAYQKTTNPWDVTRVPGGSSGGSAAAVSASEALVALGSDTGGSIRQPASLCGVVGLKPTYGRVSRHGVIALSSSLDQVGPLACTVSDARVLYETIAGADPLDATTVVHTDDPATGKGLMGLRVGYLEDADTTGMDPEVLAQVQKALKLLESAGAKIQPVKIDSVKLALALYYVIVTSEVSSNLARYDGIRYGVDMQPKPKETFLQYTTRIRSHGLGMEAQRRTLLGTYTLSKGYADRYYHRAHELQGVLERDFDAVFHDVDLLFGPTSPTVAFPLGEKFNDPLTMYLSDIFTVPANIANLPAISIPIGFAHHLPVGGQFIGPRFGENLVFRAALGLEAECGFANLRAGKAPLHQA